MSFVSKLCDGKDSSIEAPIVAMFILAVGFVFLAAYMAVFRDVAVSLSDFGLGSAGILGGGGAAHVGQGWQRKMETKPEKEDL